MKSIITIFLCVFALSGIVTSQTHLGMEATTKGIGVGGGYNFQKEKIRGFPLKNFELSFNYRLPLISASIPNTSTVLVGYKFIDYAVFSAGIGYSRNEDFSKYNEANNFAIKKTTRYLPAVRLELFNDFNGNRIFVTGSYCNIPWASFGFKTFID